MIKMNFTLFKKSWLSFLTMAFCMGFQLSYAQPANNDCADAIALTVGVGACDDPIDETTVASTPSGETPAPGCSSFGTGEDVWFSVIVPASGELVITTDTASNATSTNLDYSMSAYSGTCGNLVEVACDDEGGRGSFPMLELDSLTVTAGDTLLLRVFDWQNNDFGTFSICAFDPGPPMPPVNDNCADAISLNVPPLGTVDTALIATNVDATPSGETPTPVNCNDFGGTGFFNTGEDVWFSVTVPETGALTITVDAAGGPTDFAMAAYSGMCGALTQIECDDDDGPGNFPELILDRLTPGDIILIRVYEFGQNEEGSFSINVVTNEAAAEFCDNAVPVSLDGPASYEICDGEEVELGVEVSGGGGFPNAVATLGNADAFSAFNLGDAATAPATAPLNGQFLSGLDYVDGVLYGIDGGTAELLIIDPVTGAQTIVGSLGIDPAAVILADFAYNEADATLYLIGLNLDAAGFVTGTNLYSVDAASGAATIIGTTAGRFGVTLAINAAGDAYALDFVDDNLYSIDLATGAFTFVGAIGLDVRGFTQGSDFDPQTGLLIVGLINAANGTDYLLVDVTTGSVTDLGLTTNDLVFALGLSANPTDFTYNWTPATGLSCTTCPNPVASPTATTTYTVTVSDDCGSEDTFETTVNVNFATGLGGGDDITCIGSINAGVDVNCSLTITADELVSGDLACPGLFGVDIAGTGLGTIQVGGSSQFQIGDVLEVEVTYPDGSNACWGFVTLEDKTAPTIACEDVEVTCNANTAVGTVNGMPGLGEPTVDESCGGITLTSTDAVVNGECADGFLRQIFRTWTAVNASGMSVSCTQVITVNRQALADVVAPADLDGATALSCDANILLDAEGRPSPSVTGVPTVNGENATEACGLTVEYEDEVSSPCEGTTKIFRTWTVIDWCVPSAGTAANRVQFVQFIKITDTEGPSITCPGEITVSTDFDACTADVIIPIPTLSDNCASDASLSYSAVLATSEGTLIPSACCGFIAQGLPVGKSTIIYTAVDDCGNQSTCTTDIIVADQVAPAMSCETEREVSLQNINPNEPTIIFAEAFDDGSYDNCEIEKYEVRRMTGCIGFDWTTNGAGIDSDSDGFVRPADRGLGSIFTSYPAVPFSCCDIGNEVMVELKITDIYGNSNVCMVVVNVEDKVAPLVSCPPNVTIECLDVVPGLDFLSDVQNATFNTPTFIGSRFDPGNAEFVGYYNGVVDNCGATLYISLGGNLECGVGSFTRTFQAVDDQDNVSASCTQTITIINSDPFDITDTQCNIAVGDDVIWPCDVVRNCGIDPTPENLNSSPTLLRNDECDIIAMTFEDFELPIVNNEECRKILRTWTITDHCQFAINNSTGNPTAGFWQYTQVIKIIDNEAPVLDCSPVAGTVGANPATCNGTIDLTIDATGNSCEGETLRYTYAIDAFNNGSIDITGVGNDASGTYPTGEHRIIWSVEDYCGNVGVDCVQLFYVVDNTPPNIVALTQTDVNLANGQGIIWSVELEISSFDVCSDTVQSLIQKPSLGDGQSTPPASAGISAIFTCDDLSAGASDGVVPVDYWLQDGAGNWSYVTVIVNVDDSQGFCNAAPTASVAGTIMTEELETVGGVTVNVDGNASAMPTAMVTSNDGAYSYDLATMMNYAIEPVRDDAPTIGLTAYDLILLGQHLLEQVTLDSPYKLIAADVNNSGSITSLDMIALRRVLLFIDTEFANNTSWRFVETAYTFPNAANPFATTFPEVINYNNLSTDQLNADFVAVKVGDLNLSAPTNALAAAGDTRSNDGELAFNVADQKLVAGNTYSVDVKANDFTNMLGYQFTVAFDQNTVEFEDFTAGALRGLTAENFGFAKLNEGALTTVWTNTNAVSVKNNEVLFTLNFVAKKDGNLSDVISVDQVRFTPAEAYTNEGELFDVAFNFDGQVSDAGFSLAQNRPNPFRNETVIEFALPEATTATLTIYDVAGRVLKVIEGDYSKGANQETINSSDLNATGVLYYQLDTPTQSATMKMIVIK